MVIEDENELRALLRTVMSAKFSADPIDLDVPASPFVADIANRVVAELAAVDPSVAGWRDAGRHPHVISLVRRRVAETGPWKKWSRERRIDFVKILFSPLLASQELLEELAAE